MKGSDLLVSMTKLVGHRFSFFYIGHLSYGLSCFTENERDYLLLPL